MQKYLFHFLTTLMLMAIGPVWSGQPEDSFNETLVEVRGQTIHVIKPILFGGALSEGVVIGPPVKLVPDANGNLATISDDGTYVLVTIVLDSHPDHTIDSVCDQITSKGLIQGFSDKPRIQPIQASSVELKSDFHGLTGTMDSGYLSGKSLIPVRLKISDLDKAESFVADFNKGKASLMFKYSFDTKKKKQYKVKFKAFQSEFIEKSLKLDGSRGTDVLVSRKHISKLKKDISGGLRIEVWSDGKEVDLDRTETRRLAEKYMDNLIKNAFEWDTTWKPLELGWDIDQFKDNVVNSLTTIEEETVKSLVEQELHNLEVSKKDGQFSYGTAGSLPDGTGGATTMGTRKINDQARAEAERFLTDRFRKTSRTHNFIGEWRIGRGLDLVRLDTAKLEQEMGYNETGIDLTDDIRDISIPLTADHEITKSKPAPVVSSQCSSPVKIAEYILNDGCGTLKSCIYVAPGKTLKQTWHGDRSFDWFVIGKGGSLKIDTRGKDLTLKIENAVFSGDLIIDADGNDGRDGKTRYSDGKAGKNAGNVDLHLDIMHNPNSLENLAEQFQLGRIQIFAEGGDGGDGLDAVRGQCHKGRALFFGFLRMKPLWLAGNNSKEALPAGNGGSAGNGGDVSIKLAGNYVTDQGEISNIPGEPGEKGRKASRKICKIKNFPGTPEYSIAGTPAGKNGNAGVAGKIG
ncbi:MAG: hypothetical protein OXH47_00090 [Paracoccaceae bacterium]|nr:hypothetical protein [Paracoccaceae bacterium]